MRCNPTVSACFKVLRWPQSVDAVNFLLGARLDKHSLVDDPIVSPRANLLFRLSEHPSQAMRLFALGLMHVHLRGGYVPLARLERYFRAVLFDAWPSRRLKYGCVELLLHRGMQDENQAAFAAKLFDEILRTNTKGDFDRVAFALACLQVKFPTIETDLKMHASPQQPEAAE